MSKRLTLKLDEDLTTKYLDYKYIRIPDYDIEHGNYGRISDDMLYNKLGKLEDIEEELGIDLITLFKALKNGFYYKKENKNIIEHISKDDLLLSSGAIHFAGKGLIFASLFLPFKDYGKTWALTKEELEWKRQFIES